ncbi:MAG TPA: hypothetical protein VN841_19190 [Bryobacteraceae bacterium]|nr:hypothetical protein [Bryobacteraceae bacterium]
MSDQLRRSKLGRRLAKLEAELTDERGLVPHSAKWRAYWTEWMLKLANGENPPGKITDEALRMCMEEVEIPPHKYDDE